MITCDNFLQYAMRAYDNPSLKTLEEFDDDVGKFLQLTRLCARTEVDDNTATLILNCVVTIMNIFEPKTSIEMMFFKVKENDWHKLKTILIFLERMPKVVNQTKESDVPLCQTLIKTLRNI